MSSDLIHPLPSPVGNTAKFVDPEQTLTGEQRARVPLTALNTLWFNTGTLCNLECRNCYIESSPSNDALIYLSHEAVLAYLDEISDLALPVKEIGFTGGEPFMNPQFLAMVEACLSAGYQVLILTNAMRPMLKQAEGLLALQQRYGEQITVRVSMDHYARLKHEAERGKRSWEPMIKGLVWLLRHQFAVHIAARTCWDEGESLMRDGFQKLFDELCCEAQVPLATLDANDDDVLNLFPEMDVNVDVPEITQGCWATLGVEPAQMMCAQSRMIVHRKGNAQPEVVACTLLPDSPGFRYGPHLRGALAPVLLNHPHCARFCVLGGGSCS